MRLRSMKSQAAIDFMVSYGIALLLIAISLFVIFQIGIFNTTLAPTFCTSAPSYVCVGSAINISGGLTIVLSQATGGTMTINGASCSNLANTVMPGPLYGNVGVLPYSTAPQFYPTSAMQNGVLMYTSGTNTIRVYCYNKFGIATGSYGKSFNGFLWINYTYTNLPATTNSVQQVIVFTQKYT